VARTIFIDTGQISSTDFHLTTEQRQWLFANGQQAAQEWLSGQQAPTTA
jgi:hypothetical protein